MRKIVKYLTKLYGHLIMICPQKVRQKTFVFFMSKKHRKYGYEAHSIIGQEYMKVVVVLDDSFKYSDTGELVANNAYYSQKQMLYQIITRAIKKLNIVIIKNTNMLERCIKILS